MQDKLIGKVKDMINDELYKAISPHSFFVPTVYGAPFAIEAKESRYPNEVIKIYLRNENWGVSVEVESSISDDKNNRLNVDLFRMQIYDSRDEADTKGQVMAQYGFWKYVKLVVDLTVSEVVNRLQHTKRKDDALEMIVADVDAKPGE